MRWCGRLTGDRVQSVIDWLFERPACALVVVMALAALPATSVCQEHRSSRSVERTGELKGAWKVVRLPSRGNKGPVVQFPSSPVITFDGSRSGKGVIIDAGWGNTATVSRAWKYDGKTITWSGWGRDANFMIQVGGTWKIAWKNKDEIEVTDSDGDTMLLRRHREAKTKSP